MIKKETIHEGHEYASDDHWTFSLDDDKSRRFGLYIETLDMYEATGDEEYKQYPFVVSFQIVADKCHRSFGSGDKKPEKLSLISDCVSYMGGVPVDHILTHATRGGSEAKDGTPFDILAAQFTVKEATVRQETQNFGTVAAQQGKGNTFEWLQFKTPEAASKYVDYILKHRAGIVSMVGFILDRPINLMGETGWTVIEKQVHGLRRA